MGQKTTITIGATNFEEQEIVANLYGDVLFHAGFTVKVEPALGTRAVVVPAIEHGQIDLEPDYAASLLGYLHGGNPQPAGDQIATAIAADKTALSSFGVAVLPASKALDTNVFAVTKATASTGPPDHHFEPGALRLEDDSRRSSGVPDLRRLPSPGSRRSTDSTSPPSSPSMKPGPSAWPPSRTARFRWSSCSRATGTSWSNNFVALTDNKHLEGADYIVPVIRKSVDTAGVGRPWRHSIMHSQPTPSQSSTLTSPPTSSSRRRSPRRG